MVWRGRPFGKLRAGPRPRTLTTKPADSNLLSLPKRSSRSRSKPSHLRRLRSSLRKKRRTRNHPARAESPKPSLPGKNPGAGLGRSNPAKRPILPASRRLRHSRHPLISGKRHSHNRPQVAWLIAIGIARTIYRSGRARLQSCHKAAEFNKALAAEVSCQHCFFIFRTATKQKAAPRAAWPSTMQHYCAGVLAATGAGVAGALAVTSVVGLIFTVAKIFSSR